MTRSLKTRKPNAAETRRLQVILEETTDKRVRRRAETLLFYSVGLNAIEIADALRAHVNTCQGSGHRRQFYLKKGSRHREHFLTLAEKSNMIHAFSPKEGAWTTNKNFDYVAKRYACT